VTFRIRFDQLLAGWFPHERAGQDTDGQAQATRRRWDLKLKAKAKGRLFDVFHNKGDDFLDSVAEGRLAIIGPAVDGAWCEFYDFDQEQILRLEPDVLVPSTGYRSGLGALSGGQIGLKDLYLGCIHSQLPQLFLIGFARPIIGNIPSICEMQARYAAGVLAGAYPLPVALAAKQAGAWAELAKEFPAIDIEQVYPVEHFSYCDRLARAMGIMPTLRRVGSVRTWVKIMLTPISTLHYLDAHFDARDIGQQRVYMPGVLVGVLGLIGLGLLPWRWVAGRMDEGV
jgi:hypothetical protein